MKKTIKINISGLVFNIDEDAYDRLKKYLEKLESRFRGTPGEGEILADIEARLAELFQSRVKTDRSVVNLEDVDYAIGVLGEPEDIASEEDDEFVADEEPKERSSRSYAGRRLYRDPDNHVLGGVCGGIGEYFGIDPVIVRILFVVFFLFYGTGLLIYILLWIVIPEARTTAEKLEMKGQRINISNIEKSIRKEYEGVRENLKNFPETETYRRTRSGFSSFFGAIGQIVVVFLKVIGIIIGGSFVIAGVVLLIGLLGGLIAGHTWLMGDLLDWQEFTAPQLLGLFVDESVAILALICILAVVAIPVLGLIYGGVKLIFPFRANDRAIGFSSFGIWVVAIILLAVFALSEGVKYSETEILVTESRLDMPADKIYFMVAGSSYHKGEVIQLDFGYHRDLMVVEEKRDLKILGMPVVDIIPSDTGYPFLNIRKESRGVNEIAAERFAEQIQFGYTIRDSFLIIDPYFELGKEDKYRGQEVKMQLHLPVGFRIFIDESAGDYLGWVTRQENIRTKSMTGTEWVMEEDGLRKISGLTD